MQKPVLPALVTASGVFLLGLPGGAQADGPPCLSGSYGALTVRAGQDLELCGAQAASITVLPGGRLGATNTRVRGGVGANSPTGVRLCGDTTGSVSIQHSSGPVVVGDPDDVFAPCAGNRIGGALEVSYNAHGVDVSDNRIQGSMSFDNNFGSYDSSFACPFGPCTFEPEVGDNLIFGSQLCEDNGGTPPGVYTDGGPDWVRGAKLGDCAHEGRMK